ncbi:hypothetical protein [Parapedobacter tibetensis]|uniref:hypothetical protein n=1 Tax=Parapedobacter tibetensis TaxID=2972951 RepID=UPI00214D9193|nr:hypothetical protein [Parapedobacter tibetensis]
MENNKTTGLPNAEKPTWYGKIKNGLALAAQVIISAPLKLPTKVVAAAKYVALAIGLLDAIERQTNSTDKPAEGGEAPTDAS